MCPLTQFALKSVTMIGSQCHTQSQQYKNKMNELIMFKVKYKNNTTTPNKIVLLP